MDQLEERKVLREAGGSRFHREGPTTVGLIIRITWFPRVDFLEAVEVSGEVRIRFMTKVKQVNSRATRATKVSVIVI